MYWNPLARDMHFLVSNIGYIFALILLIVCLFKRGKTEFYICCAWMIVVASLLHRVGSVCNAYPVGLSNEVSFILCAAPVQILLPPLVLTFLICCFGVVRDFRNGAKLWGVMVMFLILAVAFACVLIPVLLILDFDFSSMKGRWP
jgi:hypothetical protein